MQDLVATLRGKFRVRLPRHVGSQVGASPRTMPLQDFVHSDDSVVSDLRDLSLMHLMNPVMAWVGTVALFGTPFYCGVA